MPEKNCEARESTNWRLHSIVKKERKKPRTQKKIVPYFIVVAALISSICILIGGMV